MTAYVGIDLGTTYSAVATIDSSGRPRIIENDGDNITPSCVELMKATDRLVVGKEQEVRFGQPGYSIGARFKRHMGENYEIQLGETSFSPTDLSAAVLKKMRNIAEEDVGQIAEAVITIPANFMQEARDATMLAAKKAGLNVKFMINEPTAAALYYGYKDGSSLSGNYVVYDLGGGTFDVSVISVEGEDIEVKATEGVAKLGGDDFDKALREIVIKKYEGIVGASLEEDQIPLSDMAALKVKLSDRPKAPYLVLQDELVEVTKEEFEIAILPLLQQAELLCETVLDEADITPSDVSAVFLAGGSTRVPCVKKSVEKVFKQKPIATANVDEVVALGAALYAAIKSSGEHLSATQAAAIEKLKVEEIATFYFGTISVGYNAARKSEELQNNVIINKGEKIPCSRTEKFSTRYQDQTAINCVVTKSGSPETDPRFVSTVWEGDLELPGGRPAGQVIEITYKFDENGMMKCEFLDVESDRKAEIELDSLSDQSATSEIDKFLVD